MKGQLSCRCGCGAENMTPGFKAALLALEKAVGYELVLLSVCRCAKHNADEGGEDHSEHLATPEHDCCAADIQSPADNWGDRLALAKAAEKLGFKGFGYALQFLHVDMGRKRFWYYPGLLGRHPALCAWKNPLR